MVWWHYFFIITVNNIHVFLLLFFIHLQMPESGFRDNHSAPAGQVPGKAQRSIFGLWGVPVEHHERAIDFVDSLADQSMHGCQRLSAGETLPRLDRLDRLDPIGIRSKLDPIDSIAFQWPDPNCPHPLYILKCTCKKWLRI